MFQDPVMGQFTWCAMHPQMVTCFCLYCGTSPSGHGTTFNKIIFKLVLSS